MIKALQLISLVGLGLTILPPIAYLLGSFQIDAVKLLMTIGMVLWFASSSLSMKLRKVSANEVGH